MNWRAPSAHPSTGDVLSLLRRGLLAPAGVERALTVAGAVPDAAGWRVRLEWLLWALALALFAAGCICVVAYNWSVIGRWGKFALAQALIVLVVAGGWYLGLARAAGQALLTLAIVLIGPLLALFGQTYQTGADTFELFRGWALMALPWTLASCFAPAWLVWLGIVEVGLLAYVAAFDLWRVLWLGLVPQWLAAALFNAALLLLWELAARRVGWLRGRTGPRVLALVTLGLLTGITCLRIFDWHEQSFGSLAPLLWLLALAGGYLAYRLRGLDLGMLSLGWLSITVVVMALLWRGLMALRAEGLGLLLGAAVLIGLSAYARNWLKDVAKEATDDRADGSRRHDGNRHDSRPGVVADHPMDPPR